MKRYFLLLVVVMVIFTGCKKEEVELEPVSIEGKTRLQFYWYGSDDMSRMMININEQYNRSQDKVYMAGSFGVLLDWQEFIEDKIAHGDKMDVLQISPDWFDRMTTEDVDSFLLDLHSFSSDLLPLDNFPKDMLDYCTVDGKLAALPVSYSVPLFYWNEALFKKVKIKVPKNLEELLSSGEALIDAIGENYYPLVMDAESRFLFLITYLEQTYGKRWMEDGELTFTVEEIQSGLELLKELEDRHVMPRLEELEDLPVLESNNWIYAKYGGVYIWSMDEYQYKKMLSRSDEFRAGVEFDYMGDYKLNFYKIEKVISILQQSENPNECLDYLNYIFHNKDAAENFAAQHRLLANQESMRLATKKKAFSKDTTKLHNKLEEAELHVFMDRNYREKSKDIDLYLEVIEGFSRGKYDAIEGAKRMKE